MVKSRAIQPARKRRAFRFALPFLIVSGLAFLLGFIVFAEHISDMHQPPSVAEADGIIVLTGGQSRMEAAYSLLAAGKGKRLLISGVHPAIGEKSLMQAVGADPAKFACCIDIDRRAQETVGNAVESVKWAQSLGFKRVILVTNNYHMPRSLLEFRRARPKLEVVPYPWSIPTLAKVRGWCVPIQSASCLLNISNIWVHCRALFSRCQPQSVP